jgi:hypothetical protein
MAQTNQGSFSKYVPPALPFKPDSSATIKLTHYPYLREVARTRRRSTTFVLSVPVLHPALPVDFFHTVYFPANFTCKRKPHVIMAAIVGETASPRRRPIGRKGADNSPLAIQAQRNFGRGQAVRSSDMNWRI